MFNCKVLNKMAQEQGDLSNGRELTRRFLNQTFNLEFGDIFVDSDGVWQCTLAFVHLSWTNSPRKVLTEPCYLALKSSSLIWFIAAVLDTAGRRI